MRYFRQYILFLLLLGIFGAFLIWPICRVVQVMRHVLPRDSRASIASFLLRLGEG